MLASKTNYLWRQILGHTRLFFPLRAQELLNSGSVTFLPYDQAVQMASLAIAIPTDIPAAAAPKAPYEVPLNGTNLTLWNPLPRPVADGWTALPNENAPLWYQNRSGTLIPAWNVFGNLLDLLTFREERECARRDHHGRFRAGFSPRMELGLLEVPAFNEAVAALVAACAGLRQNGSPLFNLEGLLEPVTIIISHDCDLLRGNDAWTQMVRCLRVVQPVFHARLPRPGNLWWMARNVVTPQRYYFDNVTGMIDLEWQCGFTSAFYLLNGGKGRFGARSGSGMLPEVVRAVPGDWDIGIHYNYNTYLNRERFKAQLDSLAAIAPRSCTAGRAHYLRFDAERSLPFLESFGLRCDESAGYPDRIGYRCGVGGCFQAFDTAADKPLNIWEIPLTIMDGTLVSQYPGNPVGAFSRLLSHLSRIGGGLSLVFHPGLFFNPEFPEMLSLYHRLLTEARHVDARSITAPRLAEMAASVGPS